MHKLLALLLLAASGAAGAADTFVFSNDPGPWPVGVQVRAQYDYSRVYRPSFDMVTGQPETHERARPIQSITWYPAGARGKPLAWRDYMATKATEDTPWLSAAEVRAATDTAIAGNTAGLAPAAAKRQRLPSSKRYRCNKKAPVMGAFLWAAYEVRAGAAT